MTLLQTKILPSLSGKVEGTVKSFKEITENGGRVEVIFTLPDREYTYNIFPNQVDYVTSTLRSQFEMTDEVVTLEDMLNKAKTTPISIWFSWNKEFGRMNVAFHEVATKEVATEDFAE